MSIDYGKIKKIMTEGRWTTFSLSAAANVPQPTVWKVVNGRQSPSVESFARLCKALGIQIDDVIIDDASRVAGPKQAA